MNLSSSIVLIMMVIIIYMVLVEIFSVLFRITGLTKEKAGFQAISLFTNCGFTTAESEVIVTSHVRRKIATVEMVIGNIFSVIIVSLLINVFLNLNMEQVSDGLWVTLIAFGVMLLFLILLRLPLTKNAIDGLLERIALRIFKRNKKENIITLLDNYGRDAIAQVDIQCVPAILDGKTLAESELKNRYKMNFLMLKRRGKVRDVTKDTIFQKDDIVVIFGNYLNIKDLFQNPAEHVEHVLEKGPDAKSNSIELIENYGADVMAEVKLGWIPDELYCKTLAECNVKEKYKINVMMIKRNGMPIMVGRDTKIEKRDTIVVFGPYQAIKTLFEVEGER